MMMSFCKKSVHSFLGTQPINFITNIEQKPSSCINGNGNNNIIHSSSIIQSGGGGLGLMSATRDICNRPNVLESSTVKSTPSPFSFSSSSCSSINDGNFLSRKDPGGIGFIDDIGGGVGGLMSCTESLGCESSNERRVDDIHEIDQLCLGGELETNSRSKMELKWRRSAGERREAKKYPPPLPSLNQNGQPSFFLKSVRRDGRLELTEVRIERPEILRASRQDGRLRLHLVRNEEDEEEEEERFCIDEEEEEVEEEIQEVNQEQEGHIKESHVEEARFCIDEEEIEEEIQEVNQEQEDRIKESHVEEESGDQEWGFLEGFRRCNEQHDYHNHNNHNNRHLHSNHHHNLHVWRQQCVPTR